MNGSGWRKASASNSQGACVELKWRKADASNPSGSCVELAWHNASACGVNGECVEVSRQPAETGTGYVVAMRDSKNPDGPVLEFTQAEIAAREATETFVPPGPGGLFGELLRTQADGGPGSP